MARTLIAGVAANPTKTDPQDDVRAIIFACLGQLWLYGKVWSEIGPRRDTLKRTLAKPELQQHPLRPEKQAIFAELDEECRGYEEIAGSLMAILAAQYERLTETNRQRLIAGQGMSLAKHPDDWAAEMWVYAKSRAPWPEGEHGF